MALEIFVGRNAMPTDAVGTTDLTSPDSTTVPVGVLHNLSRAVTDGLQALDFVFNIGFSDGTLERAVSSTANDLQANDDATKGYYNAAIAQNTPGNQTEEGSVSHNAFIAGGQRVNDDNDFFVAALCSHMFFAGCNLSVEEVILNASVDTAVNVDPGFAWDVVLVTQCREATVDNNDADNNASFGFMVKADDAQACIVTGTNNGDASPGNPTLQISDTYSGMVINPSTGALIFGIDVQEGSGTSCDVFPRIAGGESVRVALMFIGFTDGESAKIVTWDSPTSTGDKSVTGAGGVPLALIHLLSYAAEYDTAEADADAGVYGIGLVTPDSQFCVSGQNEANTGGNSDCGNQSTAQAIDVPNHAGGEGAGTAFKADYSSMDADGWTDNWTVVTGSVRRQVSLAFLPSVGGPPPAETPLSAGGMILNP